MDRDEALALLGLSGRESAEGIRRAYLRSVRKHRPERDPVGFRRLRDAYECLGDLRSDRLEASLRVAGVARPPGADERTAGGSSPESASEGLDEPARVAARSVESGAQPAAPVGEGGITELLAWAGAALAEDGKGGATAVPLQAVVLAILRGHAEGGAAEARRLTERLVAVLEQRGEENLIHLLGLQGWWLAARELADLPDAFPVEAREAIADAYIAGDLSRPGEELNRLVMTRPSDAERAARFLSLHAPTLDGHFGDLLSGPRSERYGPAARVLPIGLIIFLGFILLRHIGSNDPPVLVPSSPALIEQVRWREPPTRIVDAARAREVVDGLCAAGTLLNPEVCALAEGVTASLEATDCPTADGRLAELERWWSARYEGRTDFRKWEPLSTLDAAHYNLCELGFSPGDSAP